MAKPFRCGFCYPQDLLVASLRLQGLPTHGAAGFVTDRMGLAARRACIQAWDYQGESFFDKTSEPINFGVAYSALLALIILTEHYLLHTKFLIMIVITWTALAVRLLAIGLRFIRNRMLYSISMTLSLAAFEVGVLIIAHPITRCLIHRLTG